MSYKRETESKDSMSLFFPDRVSDKSFEKPFGKSFDGSDRDHKYSSSRHSHSRASDDTSSSHHSSPHKSKSHSREYSRDREARQSRDSRDSRDSREYKESHTPRPPHIDTPTGPKSNSSKPKDPKLLSTSSQSTATIDYTYNSSYDSKYQIQLHHLSHTKNIDQAVKINKKNYKVIYDPEIKKIPAKGNSIIYRVNGEGVSRAKDPRKEIKGYPKHSKKSKKCLYKSLLVPKFVYDKDSIGPAPPVEIVTWGFPPDTSEVFLSNSFAKYGEVKKVSMINHPTSAVPLGICKIRYGGSVDRAANSCKLATADKDMKIGGVLIRVGLNDSENTLLKQRAGKAVDHIKRMKQKNLEIIKRQEEEELKKKKNPPPEAPTGPKKVNIAKPVPKPIEKKKISSSIFQKTETSIIPNLEEPKKLALKPNTTTLSKRHKNKVLEGMFLPSELSKYIKCRPYIVIHDKYVPTRDISSTDMKKALERYDWTRVLTDKTGFYIVFNSLKECERCFTNEDGRKFYEYKMYMELVVPENYSETMAKPDSLPAKPHDLVGEATNMLIKEFQNFLAKDIRERVIAPYVLELLNPERYPSLVDELKESKKVAAPVTGGNVVDKVSMLPSFKKKTAKVNVKKVIDILPMQHALNFDDSDDESTMEPPKKKIKIAKDAFFDSSEDEDEQEPQVEDIVEDELVENQQVDEAKDDDGDLKMVEEEMYIPTDYSKVQSIYRPTTKLPQPVYEDVPNLVLDLDGLQSIIKDDEDLVLAKEIFKDIIQSTEIKNIDYWSWKQKDMKFSNHDFADYDIEENIETFNPKLENPSGSSRSEGYYKISEADKIEYLPHRRKIDKPVKTIQIEDEDTQHGFQSSRVNRANNRRLAADISAQKQMLGSETDILNLNALSKRKKLVSYARSAIHNWGLYALEPIAAKEMIIEYVGESIRQQVADNREKNYLKSGIGSSYLFRIDENTVIDATKKGGIARFINHCCSPSCTAKIIRVEGKKRIVIYALKDIDANEELTYDYKFERETNDEERIRCLCGAPGCKGYLN